MPLSEHEQRLLEQMERALYAEDPKLASALRGSDLRMHYRRRALLAGVGFVLGIALLMAGVATMRGAASILTSVLGFVVMLASAWYAVTAWRRIPGPGEVVSGGSAGAAPKAAKPKTTMMNRLEERWRRRREGDH